MAPLCWPVLRRQARWTHPAALAAAPPHAPVKVTPPQAFLPCAQAAPPPAAFIGEACRAVLPNSL